MLQCSGFQWGWLERLWSLLVRSQSNPFERRFGVSSEDGFASPRSNLVRCPLSSAPVLPQRPRPAGQIRRRWRPRFTAHYPWYVQISLCLVSMRIDANIQPSVSFQRTSFAITCFKRGFYLKPPITHYWTVPLFLDHSYPVGNLTNSKIAETKASEPPKCWHFCISNFWTW
jgi:hypothetical protein